MRNHDDGVFTGIGIGFILIWLVSFLASLGLTGVIIWAIVKVVLHFTS